MRRSQRSISTVVLRAAVGLHATSRLFACIGLTAALVANLSAQQTSSQRFVVQVPGKAAIVAPGTVSIVRNGLESPTVFPSQTWSISGNAVTGTVAEFSVDQAFTHQTQHTSKSDAELRVEVVKTRGPACWTTTTAIDATSYLDSDERATVQIASDGEGSAQLDLNIGFVGNANLATGIYSTTVCCTVTIR